MKNLSSLLATLAFCLVASFTQAKPIVKVKAAETNQAVDVFLSNLEGKTTYIELVDAQGHVIYSRMVTNRRSFGKQLNVERLEDGQYALYIKHTTLNVMQPILIENSNISIYAMTRQEKIAPKMNYANRMFTFQLTEQEQAVATRLEILDGTTVIYTLEEKMTDHVVKQFNLDQLASGTYTFRALVDDEFYYKTIELK
jgi:hypothetical protein